MTLTILHVEDDLHIREVTAMSLALDPEIDLRAAASGEEALGLLAAGLRPDLVLLDVMMPGMGGAEVLKRLRAIEGCQATPVVFVTARTQAPEREAYLRMGAADIIMKPFDPMTLSRDVRSLLEPKP